MIDKTNNTKGIRLGYRSPKINVITVNVQSVLCQSGDNSIYSEPEEDQLP